MKYPEYKFVKSILGALGLYVAAKEGEMSSKNVFLRKFWRFFGLYPNRFTYFFYYEGPNSFMAPKMYECGKMLKDVQLNNNDIVLDLGCGDGSLSLMIGKLVKEVIGVDVNQQAIESARRKTQELKGSVRASFHCNKLENLPLEKERFDKVFSFSVIEHIPNYQEIFQLLYRLLKKGGELIISVDSFSGFNEDLKKTHKETFDVQRYFEASELHDLLDQLEFRDIQIEPIFKSKFSEQWFTRVLKNPNEYFGLHRRFYSFILFFLIRFHESRVKRQDQGIFLIAKCKK